MNVIYKGKRYNLHTKQPYFYTTVYQKDYSKALHRQIWYDNNGKIPKGMDVHHVDENPFNNTIDNLELISRSDHCKMHMAKRVKKNPEYFKRLAQVGREHSKEWHRSDKGRLWHSKQAKQAFKQAFIEKETHCIKCGVKYITKKPGNYKFCSNKCKSAHRRESGIDNEERTCEHCGISFVINKYTKTKSCSKLCSSPKNLRKH